MARPIQDTPTLKGEDAKTFRKNLFESLTKQLTSRQIQAKKKQMKEMEDDYKLLSSISNGAFC